MNLFKKAADTEKEIREKRPKLSKEKNSVEEAHKDDVFVLEGPEDLGQAKNTMQIRDNVMNAFNRRPGVFPYQGVVTASLLADFTKLATSLTEAGLYKEAAELMAIANDEQPTQITDSQAIANNVAQKKNNREQLREMAKAKARASMNAMQEAAKKLQNTPKDPTPVPTAPLLNQNKADSVQTKVVDVKPITENIQAPASTPAAQKSSPLVDPKFKKAPKLHNQAPTPTSAPSVTNTPKAPTGPTPKYHTAPIPNVPNTPLTGPSAQSATVSMRAPKIAPATAPTGTSAPATAPVAPTAGPTTDPTANAPAGKFDPKNPYGINAKKPSIFEKAKNLTKSTGLAGKSLGLLGKGLGVAGLASSAWSLVNEGPNAGNISTAVFSAVPMLVGGPVGATVAASSLAGTLLYHAFTGSLQESLDEDLKDAKEEVNDLLKDNDYSQRSKQFLNSMLANLNQIEAAYKTFTLGKGSEDQNADAATQMINASAQLASNLNSFSALAKNEDMSFLRSTLGMGFPSLEAVTKDVTVGINEALKVFETESQKVAQAVATATAKNSGTAAAKEAFSKAQQQSEEAEAESVPKGKEANRIAGIQQYLMENGVEGVEITGKMDGATYDGLQDISNKISSLGITDIGLAQIAKMNYDGLQNLKDVLINWRNRGGG